MRNQKKGDGKKRKKIHRPSLVKILSHIDR